MAFDPTGQVGLPQDLTYSDILPPEQSGINVEGVDVIVAYNPALLTERADGYWRGWKGSPVWASFGEKNYARDTTLGIWKPNFSGTIIVPSSGASGDIQTVNNEIFYPIEERFGGRQYPLCTSFNKGTLVDGKTAGLWALIGGHWLGVGVTMRYDTGLDGETGGVWRFSNWAKAYGYDYLPPEESGFNFDVFVPYTSASLAVGTTATGYYLAAYTYPSSWLSTGVTYTCTQVTPTHKWSHP